MHQSTLKLWYHTNRGQSDWTYHHRIGRRRLFLIIDRLLFYQLNPKTARYSQVLSCPFEKLCTFTEVGSTSRAAAYQQAFPLSGDRQPSWSCLSICSSPDWEPAFASACFPQWLKDQETGWGWCRRWNYLGWNRRYRSTQTSGRRGSPVASSQILSSLLQPWLSLSRSHVMERTDHLKCHFVCPCPFERWWGGTSFGKTFAFGLGLEDHQTLNYLL